MLISKATSNVRYNESLFVQLKSRKEGRMIDRFLFQHHGDSSRNTDLKVLVMQDTTNCFLISCALCLILLGNKEPTANKKEEEKRK